MSIARRRTRRQALLDADDFRAQLAVAATCERFEFAGSLRREKPDVGDIDIVAIPKFGEVPADDMFQTPTLVNLLWHRVDALLANGIFAKHLKDTAAGERLKWGEKCRAIEFRACCYEIQIADADNFGPWLAIRTGPEEVSKALVENIKRYKYRCHDGFHVLDTQTGEIVPGVTEQQFFAKCGVPYKPPHLR